jgi:hypothetical protein
MEPHKVNNVTGYQAGVEDLPLQNIILGRLAPASWQGNWAALCQQAEKNGLAPLLYWKLSQIGWPENLPQEVRSFLKERFIQSAARNSLYFSCLEKIRESLDHSGIRFILLKGGSLAQWLYPEPALRPMADLDILVQPIDLAEIVRLFKEDGFDLQKTTYHLLMAGGKRQEIAFEIHWSLPGGSAVPAWMWAVAAEKRGAMQEVIFHLLYLSVHLATQHARAPRLIWTYDLHLLLERFGHYMDGELVNQAAQELGWQAVLHQSVQMAHHAWGTPIPAWLGQVPPGRVKEITYTAWSREAARLLPIKLRITLMMYFIFPTPEYIRHYFHPRPAWTWPIYYPARWLGLGGKIHRAR